MTIFLPPELVAHEPEIRYFFDTMIQKLNLNRHKGMANVPLQSLRRALGDEVKEFDDAIRQKLSQFEAVLELCDVANVAMLMSMVILRQDKKQYLEGAQ